MNWRKRQKEPSYKYLVTDYNHMMDIWQDAASIIDLMDA